MLDAIAEAEDSLDLLHKIDFEFLASEPLARRLEVIAVNLHVAKMFIAARSVFSGGKVCVVKSEWLKRKPPPEWAAAGCEVLCHVLRIKEIDVPAGSAKRQDSSIFHR